MPTMTLEMSSEVLAALRCTPADFPQEIRFAAATTWYLDGKISQEIAAQIAGMNRTDFLLALARAGKESFQVDLADLDRELRHG
ncbi:MAG: UPF0175 family protein [Candidatus Hydrogenedentes bacterium]|nr:UPF0175 family protein [Candidatus Hydrogenedentota bacterium]